jgi:hypothetical protein
MSSGTESERMSAGEATLLRKMNGVGGGMDMAFQQKAFEALFSVPNTKYQWLLV